MTDFLALGIGKKLNDLLSQYGLIKPTRIQIDTIPALLAGHDVISQAQTGSGKTLAFLLPILEKVDPNNSAVQALIVAPTRELALQITTEVEKLSQAFGDVHTLAVYGGQDVELQLKKLEKSIHIVIGTPGRLLDHLRRETINLERLSMLVLDEADQMLHMGFLTEVASIIERTPIERQTMLFSATMSKPIRELAKQYMTNPVDIRTGKQKLDVMLVEKIKQVMVETTDRTKQRSLIELLKEMRPKLAIVFCRTKRRAAKLTEALKETGFLVDELHGDISQARREQVMKSFREGELDLLVATDVAARGLDVEGVTHVFNYDIPIEVESYIHRIGRTGRADEKGMAITLVAPKDKSYLVMIEKGIGRPLESYRGREAAKSEANLVSRKRSSTQKNESSSRGKPPFAKEKRTKPRLRRR